MSKHPGPRSWTARTGRGPFTTRWVPCPCCSAPVHTSITPWRKTICWRCGALFRARSRRLIQPGLWPRGDTGGGGEAGVREPRHPSPRSGAGAAELPLPGA